MVIPYISNRTLPRYFQYLIEGYTLQPTKTEFIANDQAKPVYQNYMDYKVIDSFSHYQPTEYLIYHASDVYLMPNDMEDMVKELDENEKAFCIGLYPITDYLPTNMNETPILPGRIGIWKAIDYGEVDILGTGVPAGAITKSRYVMMP